MYNWHFWISRYKIQVVVEAKTFAQAKKKLRDMFTQESMNVRSPRQYTYRPSANFTFQFGEKI